MPDQTQLTPPSFDELYQDAPYPVDGGVNVFQGSPPPTGPPVGTPVNLTPLAQSLGACHREIAINRELLRQAMNLSKGDMHEKVAEIGKELFAPQNTIDPKAILEMVGKMLQANNETMRAVTEETIIGAIQQLRRQENTATKEGPATTPQSVADEGAAEQPEQEDTNTDGPPATLPEGVVLDVPEEATLTPPPGSKNTRPRKKKARN